MYLMADEGDRVLAAVNAVIGPSPRLAPTGDGVLAIQSAARCGSRGRSGPSASHTPTSAAELDFAARRVRMPCAPYPGPSSRSRLASVVTTPPLPRHWSARSRWASGSDSCSACSSPRWRAPESLAIDPKAQVGRWAADSRRYHQPRSAPPRWSSDFVPGTGAVAAPTCRLPAAQALCVCRRSKRGSPWCGSRAGDSWVPPARDRARRQCRARAAADPPDACPTLPRWRPSNSGLYLPVTPPHIGTARTPGSTTRGECPGRRAVSPCTSPQALPPGRSFHMISHNGG